jgi:hypothetical protein
MSESKKDAVIVQGETLTERDLKLKENELNIRERELDLKGIEIRLLEKEAQLNIREKEAELKAKEEKLKKGEFWDKLLSVTPVGATVIVGIIGALAALGGNWYQGLQNTNLERQKFESALILKAVEPENLETKRKNLEFFVNAGLIRDENLKRIAQNPSNLPQVPQASTSTAISSPWAVVASSSGNLETAKAEAQNIKLKSYTDVTIYKKGTYRIVIKFSDKKAADDNLPLIRSSINASAYTVNLDSWCFGAIPKDDVIECQTD